MFNRWLKGIGLLAVTLGMIATPTRAQAPKVENMRLTGAFFQGIGNAGEATALESGEDGWLRAPENLRMIRDLQMAVPRSLRKRLSVHYDGQFQATVDPGPPGMFDGLMVVPEDGNRVWACGGTDKKAVTYWARHDTPGTPRNPIDAALIGFRVWVEGPAADDTELKVYYEGNGTRAIGPVAAKNGRYEVRNNGPITGIKIGIRIDEEEPDTR